MSFSPTGLSVPRTLLATVGALLGLWAFASTAAQAACSYPDAEQVFAPWGDMGYYQLVPDGGLESGGTGWSLQGGAELVAGNEDHYLNSSTDETSLSIPFGGSATSPRVCVDANTPVFRLMALNSGDEHSKLRVAVIYELAQETKTRVAGVEASDQWEPTEPLKLKTSGEAEQVARISFTPKDGKGVWLLDDLYIDPFARH